MEYERRLELEEARRHMVRLPLDIFDSSIKSLQRKTLTANDRLAALKKLNKRRDKNKRAKASRKKNRK